MNYNRSVDISLLPKANIGRSVFDRSRPLFTTANAGSLIPIFFDSVLPGDSFNIKQSFVARLQTLIAPIFSQIYLDTFWFYVPQRLTWTHFREFMGENTSSYWTQQTNYTEPTVKIQGNISTNNAREHTFPAKSLADYFGIPTGVALTDDDVSALPFRAYCEIWNEFFRDENLQDPVVVDLGDTTTGTPASVISNPSSADILNYTQYGQLPPLKANKYHDLWTSMLPSPQKGPDVSLPIAGVAPVKTLNSDWSDFELWNNIINGVGSLQPMRFKTFTGTSATSGSAINAGMNFGSDSSGRLTRETSSTLGSLNYHPYPINLGVDLSQNMSATINDLRISFATQRYYEALARTGSRYTEILSGLFGVDSPDARLQRPEYLGGSHSTLNVDQCLNNAKSANTPLGETGAYSLTYDQDFVVEKSFVEHGYLIGLAVIRYEHDYQQGIPKDFLRRTKFDYYWPQFAALGEQAWSKKSIYATGTSTDNDVFGYQEAWAEYRYPTYSNVTAEMRSNYSTSLDVWHLSDDYSSVPSLSGSWIQEDPTTVNRVLAVSNNVADQALLNFYFDVKATRPIPVYSIPGGLDMR